MLELAILGLLKEQELHGYELKKRLAETVGGGISFGSLYPALSRMTAAGALRVVEGGAAASSKPEMRGARGKKVYGITARGEELFDRLLAADSAKSEDERSFNLRLAFARHLSRDARIGMMERRRAFLLERLARTRVTIRTGWSRLDAYTRSLIEHGNETTERDIYWLDRLIERERAEDRPQPPSSLPLSPLASSSPAPSSSAPSDVFGPDDLSGPGPAETAAAALASWAASTAPTMPARPVAPAATRAVPRSPSGQINDGPASPVQVKEGPVPAAPTNQQPAPPAHQRGGNNS